MGENLYYMKFDWLSIFAEPIKFHVTKIFRI